MRIGLLAVVLTLSLSGCFGGPGALSQEEATVVAEEAVQSFAASVADPNGGQIKMITGQFDAEDFGEGSFSFGDVQVDFEMAFGRAQDVRMDMFMKSGGTTIAVGMYCSPTKTVLLYGDTNYESRGNDSCSEAFGDTDEVLNFTELDELGMTVTPNSDGSVTAHLHDDEQTVTVHIDRQGRVTSMDILTDQGTGTVTVAYGARETLEVPEATERIPVSVGGSGWAYEGVYEWTSYEFMDESAPYNEIEVQVLRNEEIVARFTPGTDATVGGMTFRWEGNGDGAFSGGDAFEISGMSESDQVVVWDLWADAEVGEVNVPGAGIALILVAFAAIAIARRR